MQLPRFVSILALSSILATSAVAAPKAVPKAPDAAQQALLNQMAEAQKWMGEQLWHVKEQVEALPGIINETKEGDAAVLEEIVKLRDEVKGLYVEISGVKQQIDGLKEEIGGVNSNVSGFRRYAGFFLALMLLMVAVIFVMTIRR